MESESRPVIQACYINGQVCRNGKRDDFPIDPQTGEKYHCNKWVRLVGADPQTGQVLDTWCCNEFAKVKLMLENSQMIRQNVASTDKVANQMGGVKTAILMNMATPILAEPPKVDMIPEHTPNGVPEP